MELSHRQWARSAWQGCVWMLRGAQTMWRWGMGQVINQVGGFVLGCACACFMEGWVYGCAMPLQRLVAMRCNGASYQEA